MSSPTKDVYIVIGGSGFVGRHIVNALLARGDSVSIFDVVQRYHDVPFYTGDLTEEGSVSEALQKSGATCIIHTASPQHGLDDAALYWKVNVEGTRTVIAAAVANKVPKLVFTSSAGIVFNGEDIIGVDERLPPPEKSMDAYNESKAKAEELVLAANGKDGLSTVALRPAGIFGPGDRQVMQGLFEVYQRGQTHFQIGDNNNLFDWTYVENVAYAHLLAADKLVPTPPPRDPLEPHVLTEKEQLMLDSYLPPVHLTSGGPRIPTSEARLLGPAMNPPPNAEQLVANFRNPDFEGSFPRPVLRTKFDALSEAALARAETNPLQVAGQAFFITNGEPTYFWDFTRYVWNEMDKIIDPEGKSGRAEKRRVVFPRTVGYIFATLTESWGWLIGKPHPFTRFRVAYSCGTRWHNIEKARRVLGYEPKVGVEEGIKRMIDWWKTEHAPKV